MIYRATLVAIAGIALAACAGRRTARPGFFDARAVGTISMVNEDLRFVLIDSTLTPTPGTFLQGVSPVGEPTAVLKVSPEKKPPFIIADIVQGTPHAGDRARLGKEPPPETKPPP